MCFRLQKYKEKLNRARIILIKRNVLNHYN